MKLQRSTNFNELPTECKLNSNHKLLSFFLLPWLLFEDVERYTNPVCSAADIKVFIEPLGSNLLFFCWFYFLAVLYTITWQSFIWLYCYQSSFVAFIFFNNLSYYVNVLKHMITEIKRIVPTYYWQGTYVQNEGQTR